MALKLTDTSECSENHKAKQLTGKEKQWSLFWQHLWKL